MAHDGVNWGDYLEPAPYSYAPGAPLGPDPVQRALIAGYLASRRNAVMLACQSYGYNGRTANAGGTNVFALALTRVTETYAYVEAGWTHLSALVLFTVQTTMETAAHHALHVYDGTTTKDGTTVDQPIPSGQYDYSEAFHAVRRPSDLAAEEFHIAQCEVDLGGLSLPNTCRIWVDGYSDNQALGIAGIYRAGLVLVLAEVRD